MNKQYYCKVLTIVRFIDTAVNVNDVISIILRITELRDGRGYLVSSCGELPVIPLPHEINSVTAL